MCIPSKLVRGTTGKKLRVVTWCLRHGLLIAAASWREAFWCRVFTASFGHKAGADAYASLREMLLSGQNISHRPPPTCHPCIHAECKTMDKATTALIQPVMMSYSGDSYAVYCALAGFDRIRSKITVTLSGLRLLCFRLRGVWYTGLCVSTTLRASNQHTRRCFL